MCGAGSTLIGQNVPVFGPGAPVTAQEVSAVEGTLPAELTSFVNRHGETADIHRLLVANRLVTLTGPGGVGKTRLAVRVAAQKRRSTRDGVYFVDLLAVRDDALLGQAVATALGLNGQSEDPVAQLAEYVENRDLLIVLDNCEHLTQACAVLVSRLLAASAQVRVLATTRHVLGVEGEQIFPVLPLAPAEAAVTLFMHRAAAVVTDFAPDPGDHDQVRLICTTLEGMPLAIELAAVRVRTLSLSGVRSRLDDCFRLLTGGSQAAPAHQRTVAATIEWSYELCSPDEQLLWRRLTVFQAGITLEASAAVCTGADLPEDRLLELLDGLVDKSILLPEDQEDQTRYRMLDTLRRFGFDKLREAGDAQRTQRRHRDHHLMLARQWDEQLSVDQAAVRRQVHAERANFRAALEWSLSTAGEAAVAMDMVGLLTLPWMCFGMVEEGRYWSTRALAVSREPTPSRAMALWCSGMAATVQGNHVTAAALFDECAELGAMLGDDKSLAMVAFAKAFAAFTAADYAAADVAFATAIRAIEAAKAFGGTGITARACRALGLAFRGDVAGAVAVAEQALTVCERTGEQWARSYALYALALARWINGASADAMSAATQGIRVAHRFNDLTSLSVLLELVAWIAVGAGDHVLAAQRFGVVSQIWPLVGGRALLASQNWTGPHEEAENRARSALGAVAFQEAFRVGAQSAQDVDSAVSFVLDERTERDSRVRATAFDVLTRRQWQVAELIAEGLANRDIADRLGISLRTAEAHVNHILVKLGLTSRTQVAAWLRTSEMRDQ
jgi:predicted ATPase/DNA-binding CsgD family transcriptional regulator